MALHILDEAKRCLGCKNPSCQKGCPINTPIPQVIGLLKDNKLDEAVLVLVFKTGDDIVGDLVNDVDATRTGVKHDIVAAELILMDHNLTLLICTVKMPP